MLNEILIKLLAIEIEHFLNMWILTLAIMMASPVSKYFILKSSYLVSQLRMNVISILVFKICILHSQNFELFLNIIF